jgi:hypothetical protein
MGAATLPHRVPAAALASPAVTTPADDATWDRVWTMTDWYDGPRGGIADLGGVPHLYQSEWDEGASNYSDGFRLAPVSPEVFALAVEDWAIWKRFDDARAAGRATIADHPALPADRARHDELERLLDGRLDVPPGTGVRMRADWRPGPEQGEVRWLPLSEIHHR